MSTREYKPWLSSLFSGNSGPIPYISCPLIADLHNLDLYLDAYEEKIHDDTYGSKEPNCEDQL